MARHLHVRLVVADDRGDERKVMMTCLLVAGTFLIFYSLVAGLGKC